MRLNADFTSTIVVDTARSSWTSSPMIGVERKMLDRIGGYDGRATSLVRLVPGSSFAAHIQNFGEEFLVLEGAFADEHGEYPAGTYVRNPVAARHISTSPEGCTIFVKLWQFEPDDTRHFNRNIHDLDGWKNTVLGEQALDLHEHRDEQVRAVRWRPDVILPARIFEKGAEILVLEGSFADGYGIHRQHGWIRLPPRALHQPMSGPQGCLLWIKHGHLKQHPLAEVA